MISPHHDAPDGKLESWKSGSLRGGGAAPRVLFGSVYEDANVELRIWQARLDELKTENLAREPRAFCIASGGDTLFALLLPGVGRVDGVDVNPAQIWLCELKIAARRALSVREFERATGRDARAFYPRLRPDLSDDARRFWDANIETLRGGLNGCGLVDGVLRHASRGLRWLIGRRTVRALLRARDVEEQRRIWESRANCWRFRALFGLALNPLVLRAFYGAALREGLPLDLGARVRANLERTLVKLPISSNPYIASLLRGRLPTQAGNWPVALRPESFAAIDARLDDLTLSCADAASWLDAQTAGSIDFFGLSNVVEAIAPASGQRLLQSVQRAAAPGALICMRTITSNRAAGVAGLAPDARLNKWREADRSPFCRLSQVWRGEEIR